MGLRIAHHLQPVFHVAVALIKARQFIRYRNGQPAFQRQCGQPCHCARCPQIGIAPARDQLPGLGEEFNLADTTLAQFDVMAFDRHCAVQAPVIADCHPHVMRILNGCEIQMFAPHERHQRLQKPRACLQISRARPRFDIGGAFPGAAMRFVIAFGGGHRQAHGRHRRIRAQPQINAKHIAVGRHI